MKTLNIHVVYFCYGTCFLAFDELFDKALKDIKEDEDSLTRLPTEVGTPRKMMAVVAKHGV